MASWANRPPIGESTPGFNNSSTRKKWNLEDKKSLRNLKYHFAEDGCSEVQYTLAKQLLEENAETDPAHNHTQGVHWLLRAAQQGHEQAITLLSECYQTGRGINESNEEDVKSCLAMSPGERSARRAAQELFASLSNGEEYVTAAQLEKRMREIYKLDKRKKITNQDGVETSDVRVEQSSDRNGNRINHSPGQFQQVNHISEANLLSAAVNYSNGRLPFVGNALTLSVPNPQSLDHIPCFHRPFFHPVMFFSLLYHRLLSIMASFPGSGFTNIQLVLVFIAYSLFASNSLFTLIPVGAYYLSLIVMVLCSFKMLKTKHEFIDFRMWSGLFLRYGDEHLNTVNSENQYLRNNLRPYLYFFVAFFVNVMLQPNINDQWLPFSEITVVAFVLTFVTMLAFMYTSAGPFPDYMILFSFGLNVLAKYPYEMDSVVTTGWRFLDLKVPAFSTFVIGNGIEFCLNCRALLYLIIPLFLAFIARRNDWRGVYQFLIPHCVTLAWLQTFIIGSQSATMFGLVRGALGLSGLLLFLPLFGIVTLLIPVFATIEWLSLTDSTVRMWSSIGAAAFVILISFYMAASRRTEKYITFLQIAICLIATIFLTLPHMMSNFESVHSSDEGLYQSSTIPSESKDQSLNWEDYYKFCHQPAWDQLGNQIQTQLRCARLDGTVVRWEGNVGSLEITNRRNLLADMIRTYLPKSWADRVACFYGERVEHMCGPGEDPRHCGKMKIFMQQHARCHLDKWNTYEYEIKVHMHKEWLSTPAEVTLKAQHAFGNFSQSLNNSDRIWFIGILRNFLKPMSSPTHSQPGHNAASFNDLHMDIAGMNNGEADPNNMRLGRKNPLIELLSIGCIKCQNPKLTSVHISEGLKVNARMRDILRGIKYLLNVLFNPLVIFK
ncbi:wolframin [Toxorhynchites rutilus septentrionalis]|uniref:wolframin n=1 Tax=Toxorhynchites rutilus septentrionalis TaxID=329112 RepID=UPI002479A633|nr:wolframin [Toxorhynchites rutilus septentrionalis]XP_055616659.1 wolframin [Toxorhynchites rutilus septentrionalis]